MKFELNRLVEYTDDQILAEIRRVAGIVSASKLTQDEFAKHAKVAKNTVLHRFGSWKAALAMAGLSHLYSGRPITEKMRSQEGKKLTDGEVLKKLRLVARKLGKNTLTVEEFNALSSIESNTVRKRFGSWKKGLLKAGLQPCNVGKRYSDEECFENLLTVWTHYGRAPQYQEMKLPPSVVGPKAYILRWKTWRRALNAFIQKVNSESEENSVPTSVISVPQRGPKSIKAREDNSQIKLGDRYKVLVRDKFKCSLCGNSPAVDPKCRLHVDHVHPVSKGGKKTLDNLRTLCKDCNLGKGSSIIEGQIDNST